ncbi:hypothetical protein MVEN_01682200 [Mycena venus]|uniref:Uncharacterized protein n=1 Tax=Mycena venus TaxID=2733690 RepID=A0A8H6XLN8_9AGAR|nr:hypothetical protein MVEN_01682200 [Mycena venus]
MAYITSSVTRNKMHYLEMPNHLNITLQYTMVVAKALENLARTTYVPFAGSVCSLVLAIVPLIQVTKSQKEQCLQMAEDIHCVLCALVAFCENSDNVVSPKLLEHSAEFAQILQRFYACLKAQKELGTLKRLLKQSEITQQLNICKQEFRNVRNAFTIKLGAVVARDLAEQNVNIEKRHQELLELILAQKSADKDQGVPLNYQASQKYSMAETLNSVTLFWALPQITPVWPSLAQAVWERQLSQQRHCIIQ